MENQMSFEQKVRSFTAKRLVNVMIKGLENEWVKIDMKTFGIFGVSRKGICYGGAATNAVCEIMQRSFTSKEINYRDNRAKAINVDYLFLQFFEQAIDELRKGNIQYYNECAKMIGITLLSEPKYQLPFLTTKGYKENLKYYKKYASRLPRRKLK